MNKKFKKSILLLYLPVIISNFMLGHIYYPSHNYYYLGIFLYFLYYTLAILTIIALSIVFIEWTSKEKTLPDIQIIIALAPLFSMIIRLMIIGIDDYFFILLLVMHWWLPCLIFLVSGLRGLSINRKQIKNSWLNNFLKLITK